MTIADLNAAKRSRLVISFDDGFVDQYDNAFPIMQDHGLVGQLFIITAKVGMTGYHTTSTLQEMHDAGWEIGSHTQNDVTLTSADAATQEAELSDSKSDIEGWGFEARTFAPPGNAWDDDLALMARKYYGVVRTGQSGDGLNVYPLGADKWRGLNRYASINSETETLASVQAYLDSLVADGPNRLGILTFHKIADLPGDTHATSIGLFTDILDYLNTLDVTVMTLYQALGYRKEDLTSWSRS